jgi:hypothetical protein
MIALIIPIALLNPAADPADAVYKLLCKSPTWHEWSGTQDKAHDQLIKTLTEIQTYPTEAIVKGASKFVSVPEDRVHFQRETLMYLVGRHIFNVPYGKLKEFPRRSESSPTGSFFCQPLAIDDTGRLGLRFRFGSYRGSGYLFKSDFPRLETKFGRRTNSQ